MPSSMKYTNYHNTLCTLFLLSHPIAGAGFFPRYIATDQTISRRVCDPAAPDVSESSIIADVCTHTLADDFPTCSDQMTVQMQQSATNTCGQYFGLFTDCLMANNDDRTACSDSLFGYQDCNKYTMQAYAYCGCYYTLPAALADCANEQLQPQPQDTATVPRTSATVTAIPPGPDLVASAEKDPTPAVLTVNGVAASPSGQNTVGSSDPPIPSAPTVRITSIREWAKPSGDLGAAQYPSAAPSASTDLTTVVVTYTTTFTVAGYTTTAMLTSASISTVYRCTNGGDVTLPAPVRVPTASALTAPASFVLVAPMSPETSSPHSIAVPAQSTRARIAGGAAEETGSWETSISPTVATQSTQARTAEGAAEETGTSHASIFPTVAAPALSTGVGPSETTAARNGSAVCGRCRRRSKIF